MKRTWKNSLATATTTAGLCLVLFALLVVLNRRNQVVGLNQEIQYDDFAFSVLGAKASTSLADLKAAGNYYVVTLKVSNHARRVDYTFDKAAAILVDDQGRESHISSSGQKDECNEPLPAGASCTMELAFEMVPGARASHLRISEGGRMGDILDSIFYGKKVIELK